MRAFILFLLTFSFIRAEVSHWPQIKTFVKRNANSERLRRGQWGLKAIYIDDGSVILDHAGNQLLAPASCQKLITTGCALLLLGAEYRFPTRIYYDGKIGADGILSGNIYIEGGGDPCLGSTLMSTTKSLDSLVSEWIGALRHAGIRSIRGDIYVDDLLFRGPPAPSTWQWSDLGNYYGAPAHALNIHDNLYHLYLKPGVYTGSPVKLIKTVPEIPNLEFSNHLLTGPRHSGDQAYIYAFPGGSKATIYGTIPKRNGLFRIKGAIPDPPLFCGQYFAMRLQMKGLPFQGTIRKLQVKPDYHKKTFHLLYEHLSPPLSEIISLTNKRSINMYSEVLLKYMSVIKHGEGSTRHGCRVIKNKLDSLGVVTRGMKLKDGSGLSPVNRITPSQMVAFLQAMARQKDFPIFLHSLSLAGDPHDIGFFRDWGLGTEIENNARIKSGLISGVRAHSGYVKDRSGRWIAFSFIANDFSGHYSYIDRLHQHLLLLLARLP